MATLQKYELSDQPPLTAVFGYRGDRLSWNIGDEISSVEDEFNVRLDLSALDAEQLTILGPFSRYVAETALPA